MTRECIVIDKRQRNWFILDNDDVDELFPRLGYEAFVAYVIIKRWTNEDGDCAITEEELANKLGLHPDSFEPLLAFLRRHRIIAEKES